MKLKNTMKLFDLALRRVVVCFTTWLFLSVLSVQGLAQTYDSATMEALTESQSPVAGEQQAVVESSKPETELTEEDANYDVLKEESAGYGYDQETISTWRNSNTTQLGERLEIFWNELPLIDDRFSEAVSLTANALLGWSGLKIALSIALVFGVALLVELFTTRKLLQRLYNYVNNQEKTNLLKYQFIATRICIQLIGIAVLGTVAYLLGLVFIKQNLYLEILFVELLVAFIQFRLWLILIRNIFSPIRSEFRPIPMEDAPAKQLYFWFAIFFAIIEFGDAFRNYLEAAEVDPILLSGLLIPYTLALNLIILSQVWLMRDKITNMFIVEEERDSQGFLKLFLMQSWPFLFSAWMVLLWMLWLYFSFLGHWNQAIEVGKSWWITLAFPVFDRMFHGLICKVADIGWLQSPHYPARVARFIRVVQAGFRFVLLGVALYLLSNAAGFSADMLMTESRFSIMIRRAVDIAFFGVIAYIIWEMMHALIERRLPIEEIDAIASLEGDGGGAGATRAETLVPLVRTVMTVILSIFFILTVLHSMGIAIAPLLAGAGVVGIAIGFGAQKLVQDVISGIFFLIDDAFRKGEYIELEGLKGTVEKISLRSMQLRHHLGAVQTVPYGEIRTVKNLSRDWITMKLELRLPYDADIEKVRKIIKKVGQQMLEHPEMGPSFILPLKSQGVMRVEESALIVRMKFTTKPGEQWVIRREAYRNVRDALAEAGIHFAHREVRVRVPELESASNNGQPPLENHTAEKPSKHPNDSADGNPSTTESSDISKAELQEKIAKAAGAAASGVIASEALKQGKLDVEDFDDEM